jgi:hypothetical protein
MEWKTFHHPDWSLPVLKRHAAEQWLDFLSDVGDLLITNGRSLTWNTTYPNLRAYHNAMSRLRNTTCNEYALMSLLHQEAEAYVQCMRPDPLLPDELLPKNYPREKSVQTPQKNPDCTGAPAIGVYRKITTIVAFFRYT